MVSNADFQGSSQIAAQLDDDEVQPRMAQRFVSWHAAVAGLTERKHADTTAEDATAADAAAPFAIDASLNRKLTIVRTADPWDLDVDALVIGNNEALSDRGGLTGE